MDQNLKDKTLEKLSHAESILILAPENSNLDETASALALFLSCKKFGKNVSIKAKAPSVYEANKLYGVDNIGNLGTNNSGKLILSINNAVNSVDKVTHYLDQDKLKIVVHPLQGSQGVAKEDISFEKTSTKPDVMFIIGFSDVNQLKKEFAHEQLIDSKTWVISINKNKLNQKFAHVSISNPDAGSVSEVTGQVIQTLSLPINEDIAYNLYAGISNSTQNFNPSKTTQLSLQISSWLIKFGAGKASFAQKSTTSTPSTDISEEVIPLKPESPDISQITQSLRNIAASQKTNRNISDNVQKKVSNRPLEDVELEKKSEKEWLKPPKVYKGAKSFDRES